MEVARVMLHDQDLPMNLWVEAARKTVYVQNRTPHRVLKNKTPEEVFFGKKLEVIHLKIFGKEENKTRSFRKEGYICGIL